MHFKKTNLFIQLLKDVGFNNIFDSKKYVTNDELITNFKMIFNKSELYSNQKASKPNYNIPYFKFDDNTTSKQILGHLNTILRDYSLKIRNINKQLKIIKNTVIK